MVTSTSESGSIRDKAFDRWCSQHDVVRVEAREGTQATVVIRNIAGELARVKLQFYLYWRTLSLKAIESEA